MTPLEAVAHDIICICKYGSTGGSANTAEVKRVANYLNQLGQLPRASATGTPVVPKVVIAPVVPKVVVTIKP